jgi:hypothetical protein
MARKVSGPTTRSVKKLAAAAHWPGAKHTQHKMNPGGNYFDKYRLSSIVDPLSLKGASRKIKCAKDSVRYLTRRIARR